MYSQKITKLDALNTYVDFTNETVHGLLIIHRLLENYNQEINKYVDLPNYKINNISNKDLPANIFKDEDHWFYEKTPFELFDQIKKEKLITGKEEFANLFPIAKNIYHTANKINNIRFQIADLISKSDLNKKNEQQKIYNLLEKAVDYYDLIYAYEINLKSNLNKILPDKDNQPILETYSKAIDILISVRIKDYNNFESKVKDLDNSINNNRNLFPNKYKTKIFPLLEEIVNISNQLQNNPSLPKEYFLYGKDYYYYNIALIDKYNRYGNGFIYFLNNYLVSENINVLKRFEYPHYYKVIYPRKLEKEVKIIESNLKNISSLPKELKNRKVEYDSKKIISVDSNVVSLLLYDNKIQDGDIVSINFNGKWIYQNISLETKPKEFRLKLNKTGKNYIVVHAENVGWMPPNTIGIKYKYHGKDKTVVLQSDLNTSELLELKIDNFKP